MGALDELYSYKREFGREAESRIAARLITLAQARCEHPEELIRLHETVLFLRAFPQSARVAKLADRILFTFADRLAGIDLSDFDDPRVSGIAGTAVSTNFSYEFAQSLVARHESAVSIDWENYEHPERLGAVLARLLPLAQELYAVEPYVDWRAWFESSGRSLKWVLQRVDPLVYGLLEMPLRWEITANASRSGLRLAGSTPFYRQGPLLKRSDVSLGSEFASLSIKARRVSAPAASQIFAVIVDTSASRYRELHGFQYPDRRNVFHADLGRGVDLYFFGVDPGQRLPLRAYHCGMFFSNGVPMGYVETLSRGGRMEVGFNLYYTFRDGETAWVFARVLKVLREQVGGDCFSIDPYQLGRGNEEAIESGAFWFYRKLGFAPRDANAARLIAREEKKIAADPAYRTAPKVLRKLAASPLFYQPPKRTR